MTNTFELFIDNNPTDITSDQLIDLEFLVKKDWTDGGGFTGNIIFTNNGEPLQGWIIEFEADFEIFKIWNAEIISRVGNRYVIQNIRSKQTVNTSETITFGFNALVDGQTIVEPSNFIFNQQLLEVRQDPNVEEASLTPEAIAVGFEQHEVGIDYDLAVQKQDWNATWMSDSLMSGNADKA